ncbi:rRNA adenine N-6-methyltransferase family protein [Planococcus sp. N028]|uniref:rRNA adenine N-6-methyltransferase family protein n=1 Tax=Planococcus shixiaomingii TaxID=3058393 RepID=A0ABT8MXG3_9BACL|nr:rRNA adenine N-6-methyltransferase family protein [Planococcus sp. N028]MDN7240321.1 rRNA adenine N-6-methyltransferase family protein [Planococcus sp. N028]
MIPMQFISQYVKHPRSVGAVLPSSPQLTQQMVASINFDIAQCIVEYGPGTGVFTDQLIQKKRENTLLLVFENNEKFHRILQQKYEGIKNVHIIYDSAEHVSRYLRKYGFTNADYIVSGLPFASLPKEVSEQILTETRKVLGTEGEFITFQYTKFKQKYFKTFFSDIEINKVILNMPPAFVFKCTR